MIWWPQLKFLSLHYMFHSLIATWSATANSGLLCLTNYWLRAAEWTWYDAEWPWYATEKGSQLDAEWLLVLAELLNTESWIDFMLTGYFWVLNADREVYTTAAEWIGICWIAAVWSDCFWPWFFSDPLCFSFLFSSTGNFAWWAHNLHGQHFSFVSWDFWMLNTKVT